MNYSKARVKIILDKKAIRISIAYRPLETCLWGGGEGGVLSPDFVHQMCHQGGGGGSLAPTLSTRCATRRGEGGVLSPNLLTNNILKCEADMMNTLGDIDIQNLRPPPPNIQLYRSSSNKMRKML